MGAALKLPFSHFMDEWFRTYMRRVEWEYSQGFQIMVDINAIKFIPHSSVAKLCKNDNRTTL